MANNRLGTQFHEKFSLSRQAIFQILNAVANETHFSQMSKSKRDELFQQQTSLGRNYIKSMPQYARGTGLLGFDGALTVLGEVLIRYDPILEQTGTQWLMHYHLSAPHGPGPTFWNDIVSKRFYTRNVFSTDEIVEQIGNYIWQTENKILAINGVKSTATIFIGTYVKPEGLGKLRIIDVLDSGRYCVSEPIQASAWSVGYALLDFWEANYPGRISIGLDTLQESEFPRLFMLGKSELDGILQILQEARYIDVHRTAPPYQVVLLRQDREPLLEKLYGTT